MIGWLRHGVEAVVNTAWNPKAFFKSTSVSWKDALLYNALFTAVIQLALTLFLNSYYNIYAQAGLRGALLTGLDVLIRPLFIVISVVVWAALVYATLRFFEEGSFPTMLGVVGYGWLVSYPYVLVNTALYVVEEVLVSTDALTWVTVTSWLVSAASIIHITVATVLGLREKVGASWWQGVLAALVVPLLVFAIVVGGAILLTAA